MLEYRLSDHPLFNEPAMLANRPIPNEVSFALAEALPVVARLAFNNGWL